MDSFVGFSFDNIHSSSLGIKRCTLEGLIKQPLLPDIKDKVGTFPTGDGELYFNSSYSQQSIKVDFAYGPINEIQFQQLKIFSDTKKIASLIFDEARFKKYSAKITGSSLSYNVTEREQKREYYGFGQLIFTCYFPYGISLFNYIEEAFDESPTWERAKIVNVEESFATSYLIAEEKTIEDLEKLIGTLPLDSTNFNSETFIGSLSAEMPIQNLSEEGVILQQELIEMLQAYHYPSYWSCELKKEEDEVYFLINNIGDVDMFLSLTVGPKGVYTMFLDGQEKWTIQKDTQEVVRFDGHLETFLREFDNFPAAGCKLVKGNFFSIPPGEHRLSLLFNGTSRWDSKLIKKVEFHYLYL